MADSAPCTVLPLVDLQRYNISTASGDLGEDELRRLASLVYEACTTYGFLCVKNHGICQKKVDTMFAGWREFFLQPTAIKDRYARRGTASNHGYVCLERESLNTKRPADLKESFNLMPQLDMIWPQEGATAGLKTASMQFFDDCGKLTHALLHLLAVGLQLDDAHIFQKNHNVNSAYNSTAMRCLFYPPLPHDKEVKNEQLRCGEHSDYGSITLLFQDDVGGLQLLSKAGRYVPVMPVPGSVVVNIGDLMQRWTADKLVSTKHRVVFPGGRADSARLSIAFFAHPDNECLIECLDGSRLYEPITSLDYLNRRLDDTYRY